MSAGFQCKKFFVGHDQCAMKVGTDGLLLGAWACLPAGENAAILDIGAGTGLISLMLAQRSEARYPIDAVELDSAAVTQAQQNVANSPWPHSIALIKGDILTYQRPKRYMLIVSNPPFFQQSLPAADERRTLARHSNSLPFAALLAKAAELLHQDGSFELILPVQTAAGFITLASITGWHLARHCAVQSTPTKAPQRVLFSLQRKPVATQHSKLIIQHADGSYTEQYRTLLADFYLKF